MSQPIRQLALPLETHRNHFLFSGHYLNELLPRQPVWREVEAEAKETLEAITELYDQVADTLPHYSEGALEKEWVRPILDILGHVYHVQPSLTGALGTPDYAFFTDQPAKQAATPMWGTHAFWGAALAVGDAKRWDRPLDKRIVDGAPDAFTNANPCYQIDYYLRRTGCAWGMVSNGRRWRLYHRDSSFRLDVFYEVDLVQLIEQSRQGDLAAFRYFYLFFRAATFYPDAEGRCWLDEVLARSTAYAIRVGGELKERMYEALRLLAQGFLDYPVDDPEQPLDPATDLPRIHDACLILLYRLLFLLYAESRGLLPLDNPSYAGQYSLKAIKEDVARKTDEGVVYLTQKATIWDDLRTLFDVIYGGQETLGVPAYDGRLFDPARYPFLKERTIGDKYLAQAIDLLARAEAGPVGARSPRPHLSFVDYRDLSIRHLGSIYEGLLEYRLAYAAEEMAVVRRGKREEIVPARHARGGSPDPPPSAGFDNSAGASKVVERIPAGQVYLVTDRGERKATGSYYTPGYIVKYIVEQTLGPLADAQAEAVEKEIAALKAKNKGAARRTQAYRDELARLQNSFAGRVLALNLLDPAMGSGHFLVEATDYLARRIVEAGVVTEPLADGNEGNEESELSYWRRWVVERCIYGVDLNPLAVELAKLSLWLTTVARGKPLSFLDHHLRCGNSLIGARVADLQALLVRKKRRKKKGGEAEPQQLAMWDESAFTQDMYRVVGAMRQIGEYETADLVSVKEKERLFEETVERERRKWRRIADLWTATYFGLELAPEMYNACVQYAQGQPVILQAARAEAYLAQAHEIWEEKRFFHWEIEFPEVFFDEYGRHKGDAAGFDAVVGNPPYVSHGEMRSSDPQSQKVLEELYPKVVQGHWDLYVMFIYKSLLLVRSRGFQSFITPSSLGFEKYATAMRRYILEECWLALLVDFGEYRVFNEVARQYLIYVASPGSPISPTEVHTFTGVGFGKKTTIDQAEFLAFSNLSFRTDIAQDDLRLKEKVEAQSIRLGTLCFATFGVHAYSRSGGEVRFTTGDVIHRGASLPGYKRYVEGESLSRYDVVWKGLYLDYESKRKYFHRPKFPELFESPKLMVRRISGEDNRLLSCYDTEGYYTNDNIIHAVIWDETIRTLQSSGEYDIDLQVLNYDLLYIAAVVNSTVATWYFSSFIATGTLQGTYSGIYPEDVRRLPIPCITFATPPEERERLVGEALDHEKHEVARKARNAKGDFAPFADFRQFRDPNSPLGRWLDARLSAEPEQSDVVHDLLAHLAGRMIEMHKQKQAEVRTFLDWLAEYTGRPVDQWALKTNLRRYYEHDWTEMQRVLKRNQRKLPRVDLDVEAYRNEPAAKIRAAWETSMETLRPLLARIAAADRLIDLIVYRLYGLTEEESAVVEGTP